MQTINDKPCAQVSFNTGWFADKNVRVIDSWLLLSLPACEGGAASTVAGGQHPVLHRLGCHRDQVTVSTPPTLSHIVDKMAYVRGRWWAQLSFDLLCGATC